MSTNDGSGKVSASTRARLANGLLLALHSEHACIKAKTAKDNIVDGVRITESEESNGGATLCGEDAAGVPVQFNVIQVDGNVKSIRLRRGQAKVSYGEVSELEVS